MMLLPIAVVLSQLLLQLPWKDAAPSSLGRFTPFVAGFPTGVGTPASRRCWVKFVSGFRFVKSTPSSILPPPMYRSHVCVWQVEF